MSDVRESSVPAISRSTGRPVCRLRQPRTLSLSGTAVGLLILALNLAPVALGQSQSGSSSAPPAQASTQAPAPAKAQAPSQPESQMQDQSAPPAESLGDIARKSKADKAKSTTTKVYTEEKLAGLSGHGVSSVGSGNSGGASSGSGNSYANSGANAAPQSGGSGGHDESYWRGRAQAIRDQMAQCDQQIAAIQEDIKTKGAVTVDPMSGASAGVIYIEDRNRQIKDIEAQKAKMQDQLEALAEEGRKAGADSGWFR